MIERRSSLGLWLLVAVLTLGLVLLYADNRKQDNCMNTYFKDNAAALTIRASVGDGERKAFVQLLNSIATEQSPEQRLQAFKNYNDLLRANDKLRAEHPYPDPPTRC
jgi:hypothetical protein